MNVVESRPTRSILAGLNGITLSWVNYLDDLKQFEQTVLPLLREVRLRE